MAFRGGGRLERRPTPPHHRRQSDAACFLAQREEHQSSQPRMNKPTNIATKMPFGGGAGCAGRICLSRSSQSRLSMSFSSTQPVD